MTKFQVVVFLVFLAIFFMYIWLLGKTWSGFSSMRVIVIKNVRARRDIHSKCTPKPSHFASEGRVDPERWGDCPCPAV